MVQQKVQLMPAKRFFVEMLTKDIELEDAILDLLDNCLDGAIRTGSDNPDLPYDKYWADITFDKDHFKITDNCGGIPKDIAINYAFRMGRPIERTDLNGDLPTVGIYGIGMKRSIFKMGLKAKVISYTEHDIPFSVSIDDNWMKSEEWTLDLIEEDKSSTKDFPYGTTILIDELRPDISTKFDSSKGVFEQTLREIISTHYSYIIRKGFKVTLNAKVIEPQITQLVYQNNFLNEQNNSEGVIAPYIYKTQSDDGVEISVIVGFYRDLISDTEEHDALQGKGERGSTKNAGWSIICNDRVVVHSDKTILTGWGESGIPQYHTQFISIAGVVIFKSNDPSKLPLKTTKRGVDANSPLYLNIKNKMREGLKIFIDFTNKWKSKDSIKTIQITDKTEKIDAIDFLEKNPEVLKHLTTTHKIGKGQQYKPKLPAPKSNITTRRISFSRDISDIQTIREHYFDNIDASPNEIGEKCFDEILKMIKEY